MPWKLTLSDGVVLLEDELTLGEVEEIEAITEESWLTLSPLRSGRHARAIAQVAYARLDPATAEAKAKAVTMKEALGAFERVEDDLPDEYEDGNPPKAGDTATAG